MPLEDGRTRRALLKQAPAQFTLLAGIAVFSSSISRTQTTGSTVKQ
jgi:hypothetical protein